MIKVYSTFVKDTSLNPQGQILDVKIAGPAFWVEKELQKVEVPYNLDTKEQLEVEILIDATGEHGTITSTNIRQNIIKPVENELTIISTLGAEWIFDHQLPQNNLIFLDIQGFARANRMNKDSFNYQNANWDNIFCLKGTEEEFSQLPQSLVEKQKSRLLIITKGKRGFDVYYKNQLFSFLPSKIISSPNTIGAGDTFLTAFAIKFQATKNIQKSAEFADQETTTFLKAK